MTALNNLVEALEAQDAPEDGGWRDNLDKISLAMDVILRMAELLSTGKLPPMVSAELLNAALALTKDVNRAIEAMSISREGAK